MALIDANLQLLRDERPEYVAKVQRLLDALTPSQVVNNVVTSISPSRAPAKPTPAGAPGGPDEKDKKQPLGAAGAPPKIMTDVLAVVRAASEAVRLLEPSSWQQMCDAKCLPPTTSPVPPTSLAGARARITANAVRFLPNYLLIELVLAAMALYFGPSALWQCVCVAMLFAGVSVLSTFFATRDAAAAADQAAAAALNAEAQKVLYIALGLMGVGALALSWMWWTQMSGLALFLFGVLHSLVLAHALLWNHAHALHGFMGDQKYMALRVLFDCTFPNDLKAFAGQLAQASFQSGWTIESLAEAPAPDEWLRVCVPEPKRDSAEANAQARPGESHADKVAAAKRTHTGVHAFWLVATDVSAFLSVTDAGSEEQSDHSHPGVGADVDWLRGRVAEHEGAFAECGPWQAFTAALNAKLEATAATANRPKPDLF